MNLTTEYKKKVLQAVLEGRKNYGGSEASYAKSLGISPTAFSRLKKGFQDRILADNVWLTLGRHFDVSIREVNWKIARTKVYEEIEDNLKTCKDASLSMILVDECGIGKTFCARHIAKRMKDTFYVDCSQAKTKQQFVRLIAKTVGVDPNGKYVDVKANLKYFISCMDRPLIILDEAGDLEYSALLELKELWNATEQRCGWYMMGADGLKAKIKKGVERHKVGYAELFSRFSDEFIKLVPTAKQDKQYYYMQLIGDVASVNVQDATQVNRLVKKCLSEEKTLRHLQTLIQIRA